MVKLKINNLLTMTTNELYANKKTMFLFVSIITLIFSIALSLLSVAFSIKINYSNDIDLKYPDGLTVQTDADINQLDVLSNKCDVVYLVERKITNNCYFKSNQNIDFVGTYEEVIIDNEVYYNYNSGEAHVFFGGLPNSFSKAVGITGFMVEGRLWDASDNQNNVIFISNYFANKLNVSVGDSIQYYWDKNAEYMDYIVTGIYDVEVLPSDFDYIPGFVIPLQSLLSTIEENIGTFDPVIYCGTNISSDMIDVYLYAKDKNISFITLNNFFKVIEEVKLMEYAFVALSVIVILIAILVFKNLITMFLGERTHFIGVLKSVGMTQKQIAGLYILICFIVECIAFILGTLLSLLINVYIGRCMEGVLSFSFIISFKWFVPIVAFIIMILLSALVVLALNKKLKKMQIVEIIRTED